MSTLEDVLDHLYYSATDERDKGEKFERLMLQVFRAGRFWTDRFSNKDRVEKFTEANTRLRERLRGTRATCSRLAPPIALRARGAQRPRDPERLRRVLGFVPCRSRPTREPRASHSHCQGPDRAEHL